MTVIRRFGVVLTAFGFTFLAGCQSESAQAGPAEWPVDAEPRFAVGDTAGGDAMVFAKISDARLTIHGLVVVADGGANAILAFDSAGTRVGSVGRRGQGPGEFIGGLTLAEGPGDSVAVWDSGLMRWSLVDARDGAARTVAEGLPVPSWVHAGLLIHSELPLPPAWLPGALKGISAANPDARFARLDDEGVLWVSRDAGLRHWEAYIDSAPPIAAVTIPDGMSVLQFVADGIVGIAADSIGLERVVIHTLHRLPHAEVDFTPAVTDSTDREARAALLATMRNWVVAQEVHYAVNAGYTMSMDSLNLAMPEGTKSKVLEASQRGWRGVAWFPATGFSCAMTIGMTLPAGWGEGEPACGWGR